MDLVSIIVPIYNMGKVVERGVQTLLQQTYENIEIILIDDGSTDDSLKKCNKSAKLDDRIKVFHKENGGSGSARNMGIEKSQGKYLYFHDIDDTISPIAIEKLASVMNEKDVDLVVCGFELYDGEKVTKTIKRVDGLYRTGEDVRNDFYEHSFMYKEKGILGAAWSKIYRAELIKKYDIRFPDLRRSQDEIFVARYTSYIKNVYFIEDVLCRYYTNDSRTFWDKLTNGYYYIAKQSTKYLMDIVYGWNTDNISVRNKIQNDYFYKTFLSLWSLFNAKWGYTLKQKFTKIKEINEDYVTNSYNGDFGANNNQVLKAMRNKQYLILYLRLMIYSIEHKNDK